MLTFGYCPTRKLLEDQAWRSVERFSLGALCLIGMVGNLEFRAVQSECTEARAFVSEARWKLNRHRQWHNC